MNPGEKGGGGPAAATSGGPDQWLEQAKKCKYLTEGDMKKLCELVKECLMEGSYISAPRRIFYHFPHPRHVCKRIKTK